ncbi:MAG TPA: hypothetical protein VN224_16820, partial [Xanthomonadales bacterium]|nr:hypothetical protein [Xanthomonadales bacterium]
MNPTEAGSLPKVRLSRAQWARMVVVGLLVVLALARPLADFVRVVYPLSYFGYTTDGDGVVTRAPAIAPGAATGKVRHPRSGARAAASTAPIDTLVPGDRVRIDRINPLDRKPGLVGGRTYTYDNRDRWLPIERGERERVTHLVAKQEPVQARFTELLRIVLCVVAAGLGAMLFLVRPSIATAAFFVFSLAALDAPATWLDLIIPMPWRPVPEWISDTIRGFVRPALLLFAFCLIDGDADVARERVFAWFAVALAAALGTANAYAQWSMNYAALPAEHLDRIVHGMTQSISVLVVLALVVAFARAAGNDRHRISWIAAAFIFAGAARWASDTFYPGHIPFWINGLLVSAAIVPI